MTKDKRLIELIDKAKAAFIDLRDHLLMSEEQAHTATPKAKSVSAQKARKRGLTREQEEHEDARSRRR